jgi:hypothetical protein
MEAMALESLVASAWKLDGFLSVVRHPIRVPSGYSDIDVIGIRADGQIRLAECKVRGPARRVNVESPSKAWTALWDDALLNAGRIWKTPPPWLAAPTDVSRLEFHLVGNVWFRSQSEREHAEARLTSELRRQLPAGLRENAVARVFSSVELLMRAIRQVRAEVVEKRWGRRYGDPLLDALRELVRYAHPLPTGAHGVKSAIQATVREDLISALFDPVQ